MSRCGSEGIDDADLLSEDLRTKSGGYSGVLTFRIDHDHRPRIGQKLRDDDAAALAAAAPGNDGSVPVIPATDRYASGRSSLATAVLSFDPFGIAIGKSQEVVPRLILEADFL